MNENQLILQRVAIQNAMKNQRNAGDLFFTAEGTTYQYVCNHTIVNSTPEGVASIVTSSDLHLPESVTICEDAKIRGSGTVYVGDMLIYNGSPKSNTPNVTSIGDISGVYNSNISIGRGLKRFD